MSFKGDIRSLPLSDVLQNLSANQKSGTLSIQGGEAVRRIRFRDGKIVSYADDQGFSILEWLTEKGVVPEESRQEVLRRSGRTRKRTLGEVLRDMGLLDLESYRTYFADLLRETLFETLSVREGTFSFSGDEAQDEMDDREALALDLELSPVSLLMEAARRADDWEKIRRHIPSEDAIYQAVAPLEPKEIPAERPEKGAVALDG